MASPILPPISHSWLGSDINYADALEMQEAHVKRLRDGQDHEHLYLLQHAPVYTIGRTRDQSSLLNPEALPHPLHIISRGGQATYHGPGQLVGYPIINLNQRRHDLHLYIRLIEQAIIDLAAELGISAGRKDGMTGVWIGDRKLASIGVGVRRWITLHGFALNVEPSSLIPFQAITPCGLQGVSMTSLSDESGQNLDTQAVAELFVPHFQKAMDQIVANE